MLLKTISIAIVSIACFSCTANTKNKSNQLSGQNVIPKVEYGDIFRRKLETLSLKNLIIL